MQSILDYHGALQRNGQRMPDEYVVLEKQANSRVRVFDSQVQQEFSALNLAANDLFCFSQNPRVKAAAKAAIDTFGVSNCGCHALNGRNANHRDLEAQLAVLKGLPHSHLFLNAWMAVSGFLNSYCHFGPPMEGFSNKQPVLILADTLSHACQMSAANGAQRALGRKGSASSHIRFQLYRHVDASDLDKRLKRYWTPETRVVVLTDSVFSMDGDIAPLPELVEVLKQYPGSVLFLDEAHATGMLGETGRGLIEHFGMTAAEIQAAGVEPVVMTTFSKFAGSAGAAISTFHPELIDLLNFTPSSIGTISLSPPLAAAAQTSIELLLEDSDRPKRLRQNAQMIRDRLNRAGFETPGYTPVIPVILPEECHPQLFARKLLHDHGIWIAAVWYVAKPRLRIVANSELSLEQIDAVIAAMETVRDELLGSPKTTVPLPLEQAPMSVA